MINPEGGVIVAGVLDGPTEIASGDDGPEGNCKQLVEYQGTTITGHSHLE
jgi:hypothetical protein